MASQAAFVKQSYYLEPEAVGRKAFGLLRTVLAESELQAICKIVIKDREQLAALDPFGPTMLLSTLYWPDEVRDVGELDLPSEEQEVKASELAMARQLVEALTGEFDPARYHDEYREALLKVIEAKVDGQPVEAPEPVAETSKLTDLMAVLEASVAAARADAGKGAEARPSRSASKASASDGPAADAVRSPSRSTPRARLARRARRPPRRSAPRAEAPRVPRSSGTSKGTPPATLGAASRPEAMSGAAVSQQLPLPPRWRRRQRRPSAARAPRLSRWPPTGGSPFDDDERFFEPWWPGAHVFLCRSGDRVELRTEHLSDPLAAFPELRDVAERLSGDGIIVEGTLLALDAEGRPDARLLRRILTGGSGEEAEGALVASDLVYHEGRSLARHPFVERRRRLASILPASDRCVLSRGLVGEGVTLGRAVASLGCRPSRRGAWTGAGGLAMPATTGCACASTSRPACRPVPSSCSWSACPLGG